MMTMRAAPLPAETSLSMQDKVILEHLTVLPDRIEATVRIADARYRSTTPELMAKVTERFPTMPYHACRNGVGATFGAVMEQTSVPHLLEHLVIDIQTHEHAKDERRASDQIAFTGTTQWSAEDPAVALVRVSFLDDLVALGAFKEAVYFINRSIMAISEKDKERE